MTNTYWEARRTNLYYQAALQYVKVVGYDAASMIDVGGGPTPFASWMSWIPRRVVLDVKIAGPRDPGVEYVETDFLTWEPDRKFDLVTCMQVLEHIEDVVPFAEKLKRIGNNLIISVPNLWKGGTPGHVQDPVDNKKVWTWFRLAPNYSQVFPEPFGPPRLIQYYDLANGPARRFDLDFVRKAILERRASFETP